MSDKPDSKPSEEKQFRILPHPDEPSDSSKPNQRLAPNAALQAFNTPGPVLPSREALIDAGPPATSEELAIRTAELNG